MESFKTIIVATTNIHKFHEISTIGKEFEISILSPAQIQSQKKLSAPPIVEESGKTYRENALLKARAFSAWSGSPALGDDSGLEVAALDNRPGLFSSRYAGEGATDVDLVKKILFELDEIEKVVEKPIDRTACYRSSLALVFADSPEEIYADSSLSGTILSSPKGTKGFGYDPIFYLLSLEMTFAEMNFEMVCRHGFRACAARKLFSELLER